MTCKTFFIPYITEIILVVLFSCSNHKLNQNIISELNKASVELPLSNPLSYSDDFISGLKDWRSYSVVGLGESAHGGKEFFELKHRLFKYLVENENFKVLAYEFSFRTSLKIDKYITQGVGHIDSLFASELWVQDNYEVQDLIKWIREYNIDKSSKEQVHIVGIDNQLDAFYPVKTLECINQYYPEFILLNQSLVNIISDLENINYKGITVEEYQKRRDLYNDLLNKANYYFEARNTSKESLDYEITIHLIESLINSNQWLYNIYIGKRNNRDTDLVQNAMWVKNHYNSKMAIWAHTSHVQNNPTFYGANQGSMGYYLNKMLKDDYLMVSTAFSKGKFKAVMESEEGDTPPLDCEIIENPLTESINELFYQSKYKNFVLDVNMLKANSQLYEYLDTVRSFLGVGDCYAGLTEIHYNSPERRVNLIKATDMVFYYSNTTPVRIHSRIKK